MVSGAKVAESLPLFQLCKQAGQNPGSAQGRYRGAAGFRPHLTVRYSLRGYLSPATESSFKWKVGCHIAPAFLSWQASARHVMPSQ